MTSKNQPTEGVWGFYRDHHHQVISDTGASVCTVHKGNRHNGPVLAAAKENYQANVDLLDAIRRLAKGEVVDDLADRVIQADAAAAMVREQAE